MKHALGTFLVIVLSLISTGCVHEWPRTPDTRKVSLHVSHDLPWNLFEWKHPALGSRSTDPALLMSRYIFAVYPKGADKEPPSQKFFVYRYDLERSDFDVDLDLPAGEWDVRIWSDNAYADTGESPFYDPDDFGAITYAEPFIGNDSYKDAFMGVVQVSVPDIDEREPTGCYGEVTLRRPLTAFAFIATDLKEFIEQEETRARERQWEQQLPSQRPPISLGDYSVRIDYSGFLPSVYHHFTDRPIDSSTGVGFSAGIRAINDSEALTGYDFVFINGQESTIRVTMNLFHRDGTHIARVASFDIPVKRNRCTVVRGEFLTSKATGSTGIDPGFSGDFNIEYQ